MPGTAHSGGHRQKTRQQHELAGTFRKDRHADLKTPEPTPGLPEQPADLDKLGQETWDRMIWAFEDMGMLHKVDAEAVYAYCRLWSETEQVSEEQSDARASLKVLEESYKDISKDDTLAYFQQVVTLHKVISKCTDQLRAGRMAIRQYLVEFGLTPASRSRIKLPSRKDETDEFAVYQQNRGAA